MPTFTTIQSVMTLSCEFECIYRPKRRTAHIPLLNDELIVEGILARCSGIRWAANKQAKKFECVDGLFEKILF